MSASALIVEVLSWVFILSGSFFLLVGAWGTLRFPDFWSRLHAVSVADTGGMLLLTAGMIMQAGFTLITVKLVLIGIFIFITGPTASHAVANAALVSGLLPRGEIVPGLSKREAKAIGVEDAKEAEHHPVVGER